MDDAETNEVQGEGQAVGWDWTRMDWFLNMWIKFDMGRFK